jgi:hypothetical protein
MSDLQRREFDEALLDADAFEDLPGKWQAAILKAEQSRAEPADRRQGLVRRSSSHPRADRARHSLAWIAGALGSPSSPQPAD